MLEFRTLNTTRCSLTTAVLEQYLPCRTFRPVKFFTDYLPQLRIFEFRNNRTQFSNNKLQVSDSRLNRYECWKKVKFVDPLSLKSPFCVRVTKLPTVLPSLEIKMYIRSASPSPRRDIYIIYNKWIPIRHCTDTAHAFGVWKKNAHSNCSYGQSFVTELQRHGLSLVVFYSPARIYTSVFFNAQWTMMTRFSFF